MNPLLAESLPVVLPNTKAKTLYLSAFLFVPKKAEVTGRILKNNVSKPKTLKPVRRAPSSLIPRKKIKSKPAVEDVDENWTPELEGSDTKEVYLSYNDSNTPKHIGKFFNIMVGNRLKRQCKYCHLQYADLKGFNRHYEKKHGKRAS